MNKKYGSFFPLTLSQKEIYFDHLRYEDSPLYNIGGYLTLTDIQIDRLKWAHKKLIEQEAVFKLKLGNSQGEIQQYFDTADDKLPQLDFSNAPCPQTKSQAYIEALFSKPIKVLDTPLFSSCVIKLAKDQFWYVGLAHHVIFDGWGFSNWAKKLAQIYNAYPNFSDESPQTWQDISAQDLHYIDSKKYQKDQTFWREKFNPPTEKLFVPRHNKPVNALTSTRSSFSVPKNHTQILKQYAREADVSIASLFLALLSVYFSKCYDQEQVLFTIPVHNRRRANHKEMLGLFTGINPLTVNVNQEQNITALAQQLDQELKKSYRHQRFPFSHIISQSKLGTSNQSPYELRYNFLDLKSDGLSFGETPAKLIYLGNGSQNFPLSVTALYNDQESDIQLLFDYSHTFFSAEDINKLIRRLDHLIRNFCKKPFLNITEQCIIPPEELAMLTPANHDTLSLPMRGKTLHQLFETMAKKFPEKQAITCQHSAMTYDQLNQKADAIAKVVSASADISNNGYIGIYMDRSVHTLAAILGVLKSGGAYVPLDPSYPEDRIEYIIRDAQISVVISNIPAPSSLFTGIKIISLASIADDVSTQNPQPVLPASNLSDSIAYVIYTSGSTGKPKGVQIKHSNAVALLSWVSTQFKQDELAIIMASTSINFDLSVFELFSAVCLGHSCKIVPDAISISPEQIKDITLINTVPSAIKTMLDLDLIPEEIKVINLAGEVLTKELVNEIFAKTCVNKVYNLYGPSEDTTYSTYAVYTGPIEEAPLIGNPITHTDIHVMSKQEKYLPLGATGQLYLSGLGLAKGYLNSPDLTAEKFIEYQGRRLYKTGDLVKRTETGALQFIGRADDQVKINGFRVELGEIEYQLRAIEGILHAVVLAKKTAQIKTLVAYVVHEKFTLPANELSAWEGRVKDKLKNKLPAYMLPANIMFLETLPLNANGKTDKQALLKLEQKAQFTPPVSALEKHLATIWCQLFSLDKISIDSDFFQLGGNSLLLTQMLHQAQDGNDITLAVKDVYRYPTIKELARYLNKSDQHNRQGLALTHKAEQEKVPLTFSQYRVWFTEQIQQESNQHNMAGSLLFTELKPLELIAGQLRNVLKQHLVFGSKIEIYNEKPFLCFCGFSDEIVSTLDLSKQAPASAETMASRCRREHHNIRFDMQNQYLAHFQLISLANNKIQFDFNIHHLIADGWSISLLLNQFLKSLNSPQPLEMPSRFTFFDYALWENHFVTSDEYHKQMSFWQGYLKQASTRLSLPCIVAGEGSGQSPTELSLAPKTLTQLHHFARRHKATIFNVVHSVMAVLFSRLSQQEDLNIGIPSAGRDIAGTEDIFGNFINILPVRSQLDLKAPFSVILHQQVTNVQTVLANACVPFQNIIEHAALDSRSISSTPLVQVALNWVNIPPFTANQHKHLHSFETFDDIDAKFELTFYISESNDGLLIKTNYDPKKYSASGIHTLLQQLQLLLTSVMAENKPCNEYSLALTTVTSQLRLPDLNHPLTDNYQLSVMEMFANQVEIHPQSAALQYSGHTLNYQQLDEITDYYAQELAKLGTSVGDLVAIAAQRTDRLVIAILSVLKLRAAFALVTLEHTEKVFANRLAQLNAKIILVLETSALEHRAIQAAKDTGQKIICLGQPYNKRSASPMGSCQFKADDLAYIAQTSGTQGRAKLIKGRLSSLSFNLQWMASKFNFGYNKKTAMLSPLEHDPLQRDIFTTLCTGGTLVIPGEEEKDPEKLQHWLRNEKVNVVNLSPGYATYLWQHQPLANPFLETLVLGGEALTRQQVEMIRQVNPELTAVNVYGTTETCRALAYYEIPPQTELSAFSGTFPVGKGMPGCEVLVLNDRRQLCGIGEQGEIAIRSRHLSLGYCDQDTGEEEKFIINPGSQDSRDQVYLTGDLGYYQADGNVIYQGRLDQQVNLRGFRIELTSIEHVLLQHPKIAQARVIKQGTEVDSQYLTAYVVLHNNQQSDEQELMAYLFRQLPRYMVPSQLELLNQLPLTANGKVDISQLSQFKAKRAQAATVSPASPLEVKLHELWISVLDKEQACVTRDFLSLGGHSLNATSLIAQINQSCQVKLTHLEFFKNSSIRDAAKLISEKRALAKTTATKPKQSLIL